MSWLSMWLLAICAWVFVAVSAVAVPAASTVGAGMIRASDLLLNLDLDGAEVECRRLLATPRGEATGRYCLGLIALSEAEDKDDPAADLDRFLDEVTKALTAADAQERTTPTDAETQLLLGLMHGTKALVEGGRKQYLSAFQGVREAHQRFQKARQIDPQLVDASYGLGLYHLALGRLPAVLKPFAAIVLPQGDVAEGVRELERVAAQGVYLKSVAQVALLQMYAGSERRHAEALHLGRDLLARYPGNPELYFATALAASERGRFEEALAIAEAVGRRVADGRPRFAALAARHQQLLGKIHMDRGDHAAALISFQRALDTPTAPRFRWITAWAWTRSGMIHDLQGNRQEAVRRYQAALAVETDGLAKDLARQYLETPYRGRQPARS